MQGSPQGAHSQHAQGHMQSCNFISLGEHKCGACGAGHADLGPSFLGCICITRAPARSGCAQVGVGLLGLYQVCSRGFAGQVVAQLPFEPVWWFKGLAHRGLPEGHADTACGMVSL